MNNLIKKLGHLTKIDWKVWIEKSSDILDIICHKNFIAIMASALEPFSTVIYMNNIILTSPLSGRFSYSY